LKKKSFAYYQTATSDPYTSLSSSCIVNTIGCTLQGVWKWEMKEFNGDSLNI
jgi:hypothetical protein